MWNHLLQGVALLITITLCTAVQDCSGHGKLVDGKCVCDDAWPGAKESGWTGPQCGLKVWGPPADGPLAGTDFTSWCHEQGCHSLEPGAWACFATRAPFK